MKVCTKCAVEKSESEFSSNGDRLNSHCKKCRAQTYKQKYQQTPREQLRQRTKRQTDKARARALVNALKENPCTDCGQTYPFYVMQFDHLRDKSDNVGRLVGIGASDKKILDEVAKCELVCANCHAERTYRRRLDIVV